MIIALKIIATIWIALSLIALTGQGTKSADAFAGGWILSSALAAGAAVLVLFWW